MNQAFQKLAAAEETFFASRFLSPVLKGQKVRVRIAGVIQHLAVKGLREGWGVFKPTGFKECRFVRKAKIDERRAYLDLLPAVYLLLCRRDDEGRWRGILSNKADRRFSIAGLAPVHLVEEAQLFDRVLCRWDGSAFWFDSLDSGRIAEHLREALAVGEEPDKVVRLPGMTPECLDAYGIAWSAEVDSKRDRNEERIKEALERAGASYQSYIERGKSFTVTYRVGRESYTSTVAKDTLQVESAGICLAGRDAAFDLQSLISVVAEGQQRRHIVRVGAGAGFSENRDRDIYGDGRPREEDDEDAY